MSAPIRDILLLHHSHTDIGYTHYQDTVFARQRDHIRRALHLAERYADAPPEARFRWTCETTIMVEDFLRAASPAEIDRLTALHHAGLIDFGGMYTNVSPLYSTEMLARTLYAAERLRRDYGFALRYALNCDVNGQSWGLVEMLLDSGFEGLLMAINRAMAPDPQPRPRAFQWQGPSGRQLLTWHGAHYGDGNNIGIPRLGVPSGARRWWQHDIDQSYSSVHNYLDDLQAQGYPYDFVVLQIVNSLSWDNDGPDEALSPFVQTWNARGWQPRMQIVTLDGLFDRLRTLSTESLEVRAGDWNDWWAQGMGSSAYETGLARRVQERLSAVEMLGGLLQAQPAPFSYPAATAASAVWSLAVFDEHTWGSSESITHADSAAARGQWVRKAAYIYDADAAVARLIASTGLNFAARLPQTDHPQVTLFNPLPWARRFPLVLPTVGRTGWEQDRLERDLEVGSPQSGVAPTVDYGIIDLPAGGYTTIDLHLETPTPYPVNPTVPQFVPRSGDSVAARSRVRAHGWQLENDFYRLVIDPLSGAIASLVTLTDRWEWVDASTAWRLGHFVYEDLLTPRGRADIQLPNPPVDYDYRPHLAARRRATERVLAAEVVPGRAATRFVMQLQAAGVRDLRVQVVLYDDLPWIDLIYDFDKLPVAEPESVYIAFPFNLPTPTIHYETAGALVEAEAEQIAIACRDFYAVQRWVDLNDGARGVTFATPDAPLLHLGGFTNHKHQARLALDQPLLVSWVMNNHWWTNFVQRQHGWTRFRYRLHPYAGGYDPVRAVRLGLETAVDPVLIPVKDREPGLLQRSIDVPQNLPATGTLFTLEPEHVQMVSLKPAEDGNGIIVRLQELAGQPAEVVLQFQGGSIASVVDCTLTEMPHDQNGARIIDQTRVSCTIAPYRLHTIRVTFGEP